MGIPRRVAVHRTAIDPCRGLLAVDDRTLPCAFGRGATTVFKREGDGATPAMAPLRPLRGYWRADRGPKPQTTIPMRPIRRDRGWCDAPAHPAYNAAIRLPFGASHEKMWRDDRLYDICVVLDWNLPGRGRRRHAGSAIFLHVAAPGHAPTEGCIALDRRDLRWLLAHIGPRTAITVIR